MAGCEQELCHNWTGTGCACEFLDLEPVIDCPACGGAEPCEIGCTDPSCTARGCESHDACSEQATDSEVQAAAAEQAIRWRGALDILANQ